MDALRLLNVAHTNATRRNPWPIALRSSRTTSQESPARMDVTQELEKAQRSLGTQPKKVARRLDMLFASGVNLSDDQKARTSYLRSLASFLQGEFDIAAKYGYTALELYVATGNRPGYADAAWAVGRSYVQKGAPGIAASFLEIALVGRHLEGDAKGEVEVLVSVAAGQAAIGKHTLSLRCYELAAGEASRHRLPQSAATLGVAYCLLNLGRKDQALQSARKANILAIKEEKPLTIAQSDLLICECLAHQRRFLEAAEAYERAALRIERYGFEIFSFELATCKAYLCFGRKEYAEAERFFRRGLRIAAKRNVPFLVREALAGLIKVNRLLNDPSKELRYFRQLTKVTEIERKWVAMDSDIAGRVLAVYQRERAVTGAGHDRRARQGYDLAPYLDRLLEGVLAKGSDQSEPVATGAHRKEKLSIKQINLLEQVARGLQNKEIAQELGVSPHTVRNNLALIMRKIGAKTRQEAVAIVDDKRR